MTHSAQKEQQQMPLRCVNKTSLQQMLLHCGRGFPGNSGVNCPSYNAQQQVEGWFGILARMAGAFVRPSWLVLSEMG